MGKSAYQASIDAADEIGLAVLATTMAIVAVFLPVGLMPGISGQFFKNFGFTVVVAVLMSLFVARLITPLMAAYMLKSHGPEPHGENVIMRGYLRALQFTLRHRWTTVVAGIATLVLTGVLFRSSASPSCRRRTATSARCASSCRRARPRPGEQAATRAREIVQRAPEVVNVVERVNVGSASLNLTLSEDRERTSTRSSAASRRSSPPFPMRGSTSSRSRAAGPRAAAAAAVTSPCTSAPRIRCCCSRRPTRSPRNGDAAARSAHRASRAISSGRK
jgi:multidrug efflux pump subunit AcrB